MQWTKYQREYATKRRRRKGMLPKEAHTELTQVFQKYARKEIDRGDFIKTVDEMIEGYKLG